MLAATSASAVAGELDSRLTAQAIREVAGHPSWAAQAGSAVSAHVPALAAAIERAGIVGLVDAGIETSKSAVVDCLRDELRGGGLGLAGLPRLGSSALTDHCHR